MAMGHTARVAGRRCLSRQGRMLQLTDDVAEQYAVGRLTCNSRSENGITEGGCGLHVGENVLVDVSVGVPYLFGASPAPAPLRFPSTRSSA